MTAGDMSAKSRYKLADRMHRELQSRARAHIQDARGWQRDAYERLKGKFLSFYLEEKRRSSGIRRFLRMDWIRISALMERSALPCPTFFFMSDNREFEWFSPAPAYFVLWMREVLNQFSPDFLSAILMEDYMGGVCPLVSPYCTSPSLMFCLYHMARFFYATGRSFSGEWPRTIVEWGGGYGNMAKILSRWRPQMTYVIIDIPFSSCLQWLYLSVVLGQENVNFCRETGDRVRPGKINIVPLSLLNGMDIKADIFISTFALNESTRYAQEYVAGRRWFDASSLLLAGGGSWGRCWPDTSAMLHDALDAGAHIVNTKINSQSSYNYAFL